MFKNDNQKYVAAAAAATLLIAGGIYLSKKKTTAADPAVVTNQQPCTKAETTEEAVKIVEQLMDNKDEALMQDFEPKFWKDSEADKVSYLTKKQAIARVAVVTVSHYKLALALNKGQKVFHGSCTASFSLSQVNEDCFLDFKGPAV